MGFFSKKTCDVCGAKIGLLGKRKLEDGNICKDCAKKLSPWFEERRHSTLSDIKAQLAYREENRKAVAAFDISKSLGKNTKIYLDESARKLMVTSSKNIAEDNPDVLDFSQILGCDLSIDESRNELKTRDSEGKSVSFNPPRFEYFYNFNICIHVDHPFFDKIAYSLSDGYIRTGERVMANAPGGWQMSTRGNVDLRTQAYYSCLNLGNEIKSILDGMKQGF